MENPETTQSSELPAAENQPASPEADFSSGSRRSAMMIVFLVVFIDLLGFGIVLPLLPRYARVFLADGVSESTKGLVLGLLMSSFSAMQFFFAPMWGRLSDRVGRKTILLVGLAGSMIFYALFGIASELGTTSERHSLGLILLFVARIGQGIAGATIATAQAVIADCTTPEKRSRGMALIGAAFGIGFTFGPLIGVAALALGSGHLGAPGFVAAGLSLTALVLGVVLLPETLRPGSQFAHRQLLNWQGLRRALLTPAVGLLIAMFFLATLAFANLESTLALLTQDALGFTDKENLYVFAFVGFMLMIAQGGFYQMLARRGVREIAFIGAGLVFLFLGMAGLGGFALYSQEPEKVGFTGLLIWLLLAIGIAVIGFAFLTPSIQALISRRSDPTRQGEILGVNQSAAALSRILGPVLGLELYHVTSSHMLPFAVAAALLVVVLLLVPRVK
jgi:MFS family permease